MNKTLTSSVENYPSIAVIMTVHNGEAYLLEQIESIVSQRDVLVTIYVSDDRSSDSTMEVVRELSRIYDGIQILTEYGQFGSPAANFFAAIELLRNFDSYDFIAFSDQDDVWMDRRLSRAISVLEGSGYAIYSSDVIVYGNKLKQKCTQKAGPQTQFDHFFESAGPGCTFVLSQHAFKSLRQKIIDEKETIRLIEQWDWCCYAILREMGFKWVIDPIPGVMYRQHTNNHFGANTSFVSLTDRLRRFFSGWYGEQISNISRVASGSDFLKKKTVLFCIRNCSQFRRRRFESWAVSIFIILRALKLRGTDV
jgi:rhamnosyltransferase